jgi:hypothetical protein
MSSMTDVVSSVWGTDLAICSFNNENQGKEVLSEFRIETLGNNEKKELD